MPLFVIIDKTETHNFHFDNAFFLTRLNVFQTRFFLLRKMRSLFFPHFKPQILIKNINDNNNNQTQIQIHIAWKKQCVILMKNGPKLWPRINKLMAFCAAICALFHSNHGQLDGKHNFPWLNNINKKKNMY